MTLGDNLWSGANLSAHGSVPESHTHKVGKVGQKTRWVGSQYQNYRGTHWVLWLHCRILGKGQRKVLKVLVLTGRIWKFLIFWWWHRVSTNAFGLLWLSRRRNSLWSGKPAIYYWFFLKPKMNFPCMNTHVCIYTPAWPAWSKWAYSHDTGTRAAVRWCAPWGPDSCWPCWPCDRYEVNACRSTCYKHVTSSHSGQWLPSSTLHMSEAIGPLLSCPTQ